MAPAAKHTRRALFVTAGIAALAGGVGLVLGPLAPWIVDHAADGVRVWRLGRLQIDGVSGSGLAHLRAEAREKLERIRPESVAQAGRISGITPADVALLMAHLNGRGG